MGQDSSREIYITIEVGETQSQELYDFNSPDNHKTAFQLLTSQSIIARDGDDLIYESKFHGHTPLYKVMLSSQSIEMQTLGTEKALWRVLKAGEAYPLQMGTVVKLGKIKLQLKEIVEQQKEKTEKDLRSNTRFYDQADAKSISGLSNSSNQNQCRICFDNTNEKDNPLVCLCKCAGTVKYTHFMCLRDWISNHVVKRQHNNTLFYSYQETKCEICQVCYHPEFYYEGRKYLLLDLDNAPNPPYAVFESIEEEEENNKKYSIFLIGLGQEEISIGRNSNSTVVMKEISISRTHSVLTYRNRTLFIRDKGSKFGTLIKVQNEIEFNPIAGLSLQYESKLITIQQKSRLSCCCAESDSFMLKISRNETRRKNSQSDNIED